MLASHGRTESVHFADERRGAGVCVPRTVFPRKIPFDRFCHLDKVSCNGSV